MSRSGRKPQEPEFVAEPFQKSGKKLSTSDLYNARIIQKNLVYVIGLAPEISNEKDLMDSRYFGQYGKILKVVVKKDKPFNPRGIIGPTFSAYVTFSNDREASMAILAVDEFRLYERIIKASYGTTKYCTFFLRNQKCPNHDCLYLHKMAKDMDCFPKVASNCDSVQVVGYKTIFKEQQQNVLEHLSNFAGEIFALQLKGSNNIFPTIEEAIMKLRTYCQMNDIPVTEQKKTKKVVHTLKPVTWDSGAGNKDTLTTPVKLQQEDEKETHSITERIEDSEYDYIEENNDILEPSLEQIIDADSLDHCVLIKQKSKKKQKKQHFCEPETVPEEAAPYPIPLNLIQNLSTIEKLVLSKFTNAISPQKVEKEEALNKLPSSPTYKESCQKIVFLVKEFLEEENTPEKYKAEKETAVTDSLSKGDRKDEEVFRLFNQNYTLRVKKDNLKGINKIRLARTQSTHKKKEIKSNTIHGENSYSYKSK